VALPTGVPEDELGGGGTQAGGQPEHQREHHHREGGHPVGAAEGPQEVAADQQVTTVHGNG
jgi:hypothetical protein